MGLGIAIKAFGAALFDREKASEIERVLSGVAGGGTSEPRLSPPQSAAAKPESKPPESRRDPAITLLATLQRESRLIDLIQEDLGQYSDAQVGSAARPCLQKCAGVLDRMFAIKPLVDAADGESVEVTADASPLRFQWVGEESDSGTGNRQGKLIHHGWQATKVELPEWTGDAADTRVVAAAQVQAG